MFVSDLFQHWIGRKKSEQRQIMYKLKHVRAHNALE